MRKFPKFNDAGISGISFFKKDRNKEHLPLFLPCPVFLTDLMLSHQEETGVSPGRYMEGFQVVEVKKAASKALEEGCSFCLCSLRATKGSLGLQI